MPLRLSVSHSRKTSENYCSTQHGVVIEAEVAEGTAPEALRQKVEELFAFAKRAVDEQIDGASPPPATNAHQDTARRTPRIPQPGQAAGHSGNGNGNGRRTRRNGQPVMATAAQKKAIGAICSDQGLDVAQVLADWHGDLERLTIKEASEIIDALKANKGNGARR